ncbi:hypothetical protein [Cytobacillus sp. IB215665]|uniref:hypothetical protein n=1 Tax=Cytobacillus sp. IB215665 TaxID=3097357 RepID=UPI002A13907F|nr:hypothetical protein [Cytobacillus sp. IB215665]MDX8366802.1 hypothetical protein [Cytobacillus sp. IB215665]
MTNCKCKDDKTVDSFKDQSLMDLNLFSNNMFIPQAVLTLPPIFTKKGNNIHLNSIVTLEIAADGSSEPISIDIDYILQRITNNGIPMNLATIRLQREFTNESNNLINTITPNLTWVDYPDTGIHTYRIFIQEAGPCANVDTICAQTRALNALVIKH